MSEKLVCNRSTLTQFELLANDCVLHLPGDIQLELPILVLWLSLGIAVFFVLSSEELLRRYAVYNWRFRKLTRAVAREASNSESVDPAALNRVGEVLGNDNLCAHGWGELKETLVKDDSESKAKIWNTRPAEEFFSEEEIVERSLHPRFFRAVPAILTSMGLLTTFVAILIGLDHVHMEGENVEGLPSFINALSGKFASSVIALVLAIVFTLFETRIFRNTHGAYLRFCQQLDSLFPRKTAEELLLELKKDSQQQLAALQHLNTDLSARFRDGVSEGLGPVLERISEGLMSLTGERDSNIEAMMERLTEEFRKAMSQSAGVEFGQIGETLERASQLIANANSQTEKTLTMFDSLVQSMGDSQHRQENSSRQQEAVMTQLLQKMLESVEHASSESRSAVDATVRGLVEQTGSHSARVNQELKRLLEEHQASAKSVDDMRQALDRTVSAWNQSAQQMRDVVAPLRDTSTQLQTATAGLGAAAKEVAGAQEKLSSMLESAQRELTRLQEMGATNEELLAEHQKVFQTVQSGLGGILTTIGTKLETLQEVSGRGLTSQLKEFDNHLGTATKKLGASVEELGEVLDDAAETLRASIQAGAR